MSVDGGAHQAVLFGVDGDEFAADGTDHQAVQVEFVAVLAESDDGGRVAGVHQADLLAPGQAFVAGVLFRAARVHDGLAALALRRGRRLLRRVFVVVQCQVFLEEAQVAEAV